MENADYKIVSNKTIQRRKYFITFASFFAALAVVIAIFSLTVGRKTDDWIDGKAGYARSSVFPFVFTADDSLYLLDSSLTLHDVDNNVKSVTFDPQLGKVYYIYTPTGELFEYSVKDGTRLKLCGEVESYVLFKERTFIPYMTPDGAVKVYSYNSKSSSEIRQPVKLSGGSSKYGFDPLMPLAGTGEIVFFDNFNESAGTASLKIWRTGGSVTRVSESAVFAKGAVIWKDDAAVSFYEDSGLTVYSKYGKTYEAGENWSEVRALYTEENIYGVDFVKEYGINEGLRFICGDSENHPGLKRLLSLRPLISGIDTTEIFDGFSDIIGYSGESETVLFTTKDSDGVTVYSSQKGRKTRQITKCDLNDKLFFCASSNLLYVTSSDGVVSAIDIFDKSATKYVVGANAEEIIPYLRKPFVILKNTSPGEDTFVISYNLQEKFPSGETRLYGKSDSEYLMLRETDGGFVSLDLVSGDSIKRISNVCGRASVVFDKGVDNVVFWNGQELCVFSDGKITKIPGFESEIVPAEVIAF